MACMYRWVIGLFFGEIHHTVDVTVYAMKMDEKLKLSDSAFAFT